MKIRLYFDDGSYHTYYLPFKAFTKTYHKFMSDFCRLIFYKYGGIYK